MKLVIAGSRDINLDIGTIHNIVDTLIPMDIEITEVVSGACRGMDISGENWAKFHEIPIKKFKPKWDELGKKAGPVRNKEMAEYADALLLIHADTPGSLSMKEEMLKLEKPVYEVILKKYNT